MQQVAACPALHSQIRRNALFSIARYCSFAHVLISRRSKARVRILFVRRALNPVACVGGVDSIFRKFCIPLPLPRDRKRFFSSLGIVFCRAVRARQPFLSRCLYAETFFQSDRNLAGSGMSRSLANNSAALENAHSRSALSLCPNGDNT